MVLVLFRDELVLPAALVFLEQPTQGSETTCSDVISSMSSRRLVCLVVFRPALHDGIEGGQSRVFIHPSPVAAKSGLLVFPLTRSFAFCCRSQMNHPAPFRFPSLDVESKEVKPFVHVGDLRLLVRQFQVQFRLKELS